MKGLIWPISLIIFIGAAVLAWHRFDMRIMLGKTETTDAIVVNKKPVPGRTYGGFVFEYTYLFSVNDITFIGKKIPKMGFPKCTVGDKVKVKYQIKNPGKNDLEAKYKSDRDHWENIVYNYEYNAGNFTIKRISIQNDVLKYQEIYRMETIKEKYFGTLTYNLDTLFVTDIISDENFLINGERALINCVDSLNLEYMYDIYSENLFVRTQ